MVITRVARVRRAGRRPSWDGSQVPDIQWYMSTFTTPSRNRPEIHGLDQRTGVSLHHRPLWISRPNPAYIISKVNPGSPGPESGIDHRPRPFFPVRLGHSREIPML